MRGAWFALAAGCAAVVVVVACTGSDPEPAREPDITNIFINEAGGGGSSSGASGGTSSSSSSGTSGAATKRPPGAKTVHCSNDDNCPVPAEVCCGVSDAGGPDDVRCVPKGQCFAPVQIECDSLDDCAADAGQACCGAAADGPTVFRAACQQKAEFGGCGGGPPFCRVTEDCPDFASHPCITPNSAEFWPSGFQICQ